jgi:hypothetical protein
VGTTAKSERKYFFSMNVFLVISLRLKFMCRRFGTLCSIFIGRVDKENNLDESTRVYIQVKVELKRSQEL